MRVFVFVLGAVGTLAVLAAIVDGMLSTRASRSRLGNGISYLVLQLGKIPMGLMRSYKARDRWLSAAAPVSLLLQLTMYAVLLIFTLGLMVWGSTDLDWIKAFYQSGSTFTTLGIVEPINTVSAIVCFLAAFLGLVVIAIFIGFLLGIFGMYNDREIPMARLAAIAGEPAWGPQVLARSAVIGCDLDEAINSHDWLDWTIQVRTNTLINPTFALFRSTSPSRHWVISQLAILDAVSLKLAIEPKKATPVDIQMLSGGAVTCGLLNKRKIHNWETEAYIVKVLAEKPQAGELQSAGLSDAEWTQGWLELTKHNIVKPAQEKLIRERFIALRKLYFRDVYDLAYKHNAIRAPWSGERRFNDLVIFPERSTSL